MRNPDQADKSEDICDLPQAKDFEEIAQPQAHLAEVSSDDRVCHEED